MLNSRKCIIHAVMYYISNMLNILDLAFGNLEVENNSLHVLQISTIPL